jgi:hypothetical protein
VNYARSRQIGGFWDCIRGDATRDSVIASVFLLSGYVPPFILVVLPAIVGAGLIAAGLMAKRENGLHSHSVSPERGA